MSATGTRVVLMNVPAKRGEKDESFEERRFLDYLHAYQTTGKPPQPVPPAPTDPQQRAALGLPPLFEPLIETESLTNGAAGTPPPTAPPNFLAQAFVPTKMLEYGNDALQLQSIVAQPEYARFSVEELRVQAYKAGKKYADVPPLPPLPQPQPQPQLQSRPQPQRPPLLPAAPVVSQIPPDSLQSVNSMPPYDGHSFEELRLACIRAGRPLTSPEIIAQNAVLRLSV
ncbi:hypothetical protein BD413DRAFT_537580 [Trametes elegans]|nr:hypothetical protein BD413DRAFT_537580 [Trametes elegans]